MNKLYLLLALIAICLIGCSSDDDELPVVPNIEIEVSNFEISQVANSKTVAHFETNVDWTATITYQGEEKDWLTIDPQKGDANKAVTMTMKSAANNSSDDRTAYVTITYGDKTHKLTIKQKRKDTISEIVDRVFVGGDGGQVTISLKTDIDDFTVIIPEEAQEWLSYSKTKAIESKEIVLTAKKNPEKLSRWTSVTITNSDKIESREVFIGQTADGETIEGCYYIVGGDMKNLAPADATVLKLFGKPNVEDFHYMRDQMRNLAKLDLSGTVITEIVEGAFANKESLAKIIFSKEIKDIGAYSFFNCTALTGSLYIPNSVTKIGDYAFKDCTGLNGSLILSEYIEEIGIGAFYNCSNLIGSLIIPDSATKIGEYAFFDCGKLDGTLTIGNGLTAIENHTFYRCFRLSGSLNIPSNIKRIGKAAFRYCTDFTGTLIIPNSITEIEDATFADCSGFTGSLIIPDNITKISQYAFMNSTGLTGSLIIPSSMTEIEANAFRRLRFNEINCLASIPPLIESLTWNDTSGNKKLYVPAESLTTYKEDKEWSSAFNNGENIFPIP